MNFLKYNIFLFLSFLFLSLIALGQNENLLYPDWPYNLSNVVDSVQYDHNTETILITNYVGGQPISTPRYFSQSEYQQYLFNQNFYNYFLHNSLIIVFLKLNFCHHLAQQN